MSIRAKFKVVSVELFAATISPSARVKLAPEYDHGIPEDQSFAKATPSGSFEMHTTNPAVLHLLQPGAEFYIDLTPVADAKE